MNDQICPSDLLPELVGDVLDSELTSAVMEHLESCMKCQEKLDSYSGDESWWRRAQGGLVGLEVDDSYRVLKPTDTFASFDTLVEMPVARKPESPPEDVFDPPSHPELLGQIDEFEIERKIGQGGMGVVFRGFDKSLNRPVAIKVMAPHLVSNEEARSRFKREAKAAAAVVHPSVISIYRVSTTRQNSPYIAMALADGRSLQEHVNENGPFDIKDVVRIGIQIASGLAEAHKQGLVHRDVKPANVLLEKDVSRVLITDFGLARVVDDALKTQSGCLTGTPAYMSPEQVQGGDVDERSDLFSLGGLLYFISTGVEPFVAESAFAVINKVTRENPRAPNQMNTDMPEVLNRIIGRLLEKDPKHRISSAAKLEELLTKLLAHLQEPKHHAQPVVHPTSLQRKRSRRNVLLGMVAVGVATVSILFAIGALTWPTAIPENSHEHPGSEQHDNSYSDDGVHHDTNEGSHDKSTTNQWP